jgi:hypothetical protein
MSVRQRGWGAAWLVAALLFATGVLAACGQGVPGGDASSPVSPVSDIRRSDRSAGRCGAADRV